MSLKLNVGLSRKLGLPSFGSVGATCAVEVELDVFAFQDAESMQQRIEDAFDTCRVAVDNELIRYSTPGPPLPPALAPTGGCDVVAEPADNCSGTAEAPALPLATQRQVDFAYHLARQIRALGGQRLKVLVQQLYSRDVEELTALEASKLIDLLKEARSGKRSLDDLLVGAAA